MKIQAAAISIQSQNFAVVAVGPDLVQNPAEAGMTIEALQPTFGGSPVVLMAQNEETGSPMYYGDQTLLELLKGVPIEQMPWKEYTVG